MILCRLLACLSKKKKGIKKNIYMILRNKSHTKCCGLQAGDETKDTQKIQVDVTCINTESLSFDP